MEKPDWVKAEEKRQKIQVDTGEKPDWMIEEDKRQADIAAMPRRSEPGPAPKYLPVTTGAKVAATIGAGLQAPARLGAGLLQLAGINAPAEATEATSQYLKGIAGFPASVAETVGETLPQLALPVTRPLMMAAQGAGTAIGQPTTDKASLDNYSDMLLSKSREGLQGGVLGGVFGKLAQAGLKPNVSPELKMLQEMGMTRFTPGQLLADVPLIGQGLQRAEQAATSLPLTGSMIRKGLQTTNENSIVPWLKRF